MCTNIFVFHTCAGKVPNPKAGPGHAHIPRELKCNALIATQGRVGSLCCAGAPTLSDRRTPHRRMCESARREGLTLEDVENGECEKSFKSQNMIKKTDPHRFCKLHARQLAITEKIGNLREELAAVDRDIKVQHGTGVNREPEDFVAAN